MADFLKWLWQRQILSFCCNNILLCTPHYHIDDWNPNLSVLLSETVTSAAGKKSGKVGHKQRKSGDRNISTYTDGRPKASIPDDDKFQCVYISQTKSCWCYGCKQHYCNAVTDILPPAPYDMVLAGKLFRVITPAVRIGLKIIWEKENAYLHLKCS